MAHLILFCRRSHCGATSQEGHIFKSKRLNSYPLLNANISSETWRSSEFLIITLSLLRNSPLHYDTRSTVLDLRGAFIRSIDCLVKYYVPYMG